MQKIIEKWVISEFAPSNHYIGWLKKNADKTITLHVYNFDTNIWTPVAGGASEGSAEAVEELLNTPV